MSERAYRQRLETDLERWQAEGVIAPAVAQSIRATLRPLPAAVDVTTVIAILGGLLVAAAFLAFVAANWTEIARPLRFLILLVGIVGAYASGAVLERKGRPWLADISVTVGCLVFGAGIALTGQMYHLGADFAGGMALWAIGAMAAAALTSSRGALAVALAAGVIWNGARMEEIVELQWLPLLLLLVGAALAVRWNAPAARHLVSLGLVSWWIATAIGRQLGASGEAAHVLASGAALLVGGGLLATRAAGPVAQFGLTLSSYGCFAFAIVIALVTSGFLGSSVGRPASPFWIEVCAGLAVALALLAAAAGRAAGAGLAALALGLGLAALYTWPGAEAEPWFNYAAALLAMLCLVVSGMLDDVRPRAVAGWLGLAGVIAGITWAVQGSLLRRAVFLGIAGCVAIGVANLLSRLRREAVP